MSIQVAIVMGSASDWDVMSNASKLLDKFGIEHESRVLSAHRTPKQLEEFIVEAEKNGTQVFIAGAGLAAALPGVVAAQTTIPVIGVPTSVGYGYGEKGVAALASMLQSCSLGLSVVNIDNGIGAGAIASKIANLLSKNNSEKKS